MRQRIDSRIASHHAQSCSKQDELFKLGEKMELCGLAQASKRSL